MSPSDSTSPLFTGNGNHLPTLSPSPARPVSFPYVSPNPPQEPPTAGDYHSADTDKDWHIDFDEVLRVVELYNTKTSTVRTGAYKVQEGTVDGFAPDPGRLAPYTAVLSKYHSADSDRDGKIGLLELLRVIELYNWYQGSVRTGQYHLKTEAEADRASEDGYLIGPPP